MCPVLLEFTAHECIFLLFCAALQSWTASKLCWLIDSYWVIVTSVSTSACQYRVRQDLWLLQDWLVPVLSHKWSNEENLILQQKCKECCFPVTMLKCLLDYLKVNKTLCWSQCVRLLANEADILFVVLSGEQLLVAVSAQTLDSHNCLAGCIGTCDPLAFTLDPRMSWS